MRIDEHKKSKPYKRLIHISPTEVWSYRITNGHVAIRNPEGTKTIHTDNYELNGEIPPHDPYDEPVFYPHEPRITPSLIKSLIEGLSQ